jgi:hypothetical protein
MRGQTPEADAPRSRPSRELAYPAAIDGVEPKSARSFVPSSRSERAELPLRGVVRH